MQTRDKVGHIVHIAHMYVGVAVVAHEHHSVLPCSGIGVGDIVYHLIHHHLGVALRRYWESSHRHIELVAQQRVLALTVVEHAEVAVVDVTAHLVERVLALETEQIVVGIEVAAV